MIRGGMGPAAPLLRHVTRLARGWLRHRVRRGLWLALAALVGAVGVGFMLLAAYATLRLALGPAGAAGVMAAMLIGLAVLMVRLPALAHRRGRAFAGKPPPGGAYARSEAAGPAPRPQDPAVLAAFTLAFVAARYLLDRFDRKQ